MSKEHDVRYQAYWDAILRRVCHVCLDQSDDGSCGVRGRTCALERQLPELVDALVEIRSDRMDEYVEAIRARVCSRCPGQDAAGRCALRERAECALDSYLSLVVDAVEEVQRQAP